MQRRRLERVDSKLLSVVTSGEETERRTVLTRAWIDKAIDKKRKIKP